MVLRACLRFAVVSAVELLFAGDFHTEMVLVGGVYRPGAVAQGVVVAVVRGGGGEMVGWLGLLL